MTESEQKIAEYSSKASIYLFAHLSRRKRFVLFQKPMIHTYLLNFCKMIH